MSGFSSIDMSSLVAARRMMRLAEQAELRRKDPRAATKNLKEIVDEDTALLNSSESSAPEGYSRSQAAPVENTDIKMSDLFAQLKELNGKPAEAGKVTTIEFAAVESIQVKTELKISYREMAQVDGLVKHSKNLAETDRYLLEFSDPTTFKITDKWTGRSTTVWGDPHVDTNDQEGSSNGEFSDLTTSDSHTTMQLMDGTRITFTAKDRGIIEAVDIVKGSQHLRGLGGGTNGLTAEKYLFSSDVDSSRASSVPTGDVVYAGGDGNDWFSPTGSLVWGKTTGPIINSRPAYMVELEYRQETIQQTAAAVRVVTA